MVDFRLSRIVKIKVSLVEGEATVGTGYLLAPGLVVTAHHVVKAAPDGGVRGRWREAPDRPVSMLRVRPQGHEGASLPVAEMVTFDSEDIDAAVLVVPGLPEPRSSVSVGARLVGHTRLDNCRVYGFPEAGVEAGTVPLTYVTADVLPPVGGISPDRLDLKVTTPEPRIAAEWGGISGAAVIDRDGRFHGLVTMASGSWQSVLHALPVTTIQNAARRALRDRHGQAGPAVAALEQLVQLPIAEIDLDASLFDPAKTGPRLTQLAGRGYFALLHHKNRVVDFVDQGPHGRLRDQVLAWARHEADQPNLRVLTLTGAAGTGKSRLAATVCEDLAGGEGWWQAGFADPDRLAAAPHPQAPLLLVIDYAEQQTSAVGAFLKAIQRLELHEPPLLQVPVRVLLVSRSIGPWFERVLAGVEDRDLIGRSEVQLSRDDFGSDWRQAHARAAFNSFAAERGSGAGYPEVLDEVARHLDRPLSIHIAALLASDGDTALLEKTARQSSRAMEEGLLDALLDRESRRWTQHHRLDPPLDAERGKEALAVATLTAPACLHYPDLLAAVPAFAPGTSTERRFNIAEAMHELYPGPARRLKPDEEPVPHLAPAEPDLVAARLLDRTLSRTAILKNLIASETLADWPAYHAQLVSMLALASDDYPAIAADLKAHLSFSLSALVDAGETAAASLADLVENHLMALVKAVVAAAGDQDLHPVRELTITMQLVEPSAHHSPKNAALAALRELPARHPAFLGLGIALARRAVAEATRSGELVDLVAAQLKLSTWQGFHAQHHEAAATAHLAIQLSEELVQKLGEVGRAFLALSKGRLGVALGAVGRTEEAVEALEQAVRIDAELPEHDRVVDLYGMASMVGDLANALAGTDRREEALATARQVVQLWDELAKTQPAYAPERAISVHNLAVRLVEEARWDEAIEASERAVALREELVAGDHAAYQSDLAASLSTLAHALAGGRRYLEALEAARRAVGLYQEAVKINRDAYLPLLMGAVGNLSRRLRETGRRQEALQAMDRHVALCDELVENDRAEYLPVLADALINLGNRLPEAERHQDALIATRRAVAIDEELVGTVGASRLPHLASSIHNLAVRLIQTGLRSEALATAKQAVAMREELARADRTAHLPALARSLTMAASVMLQLAVEHDAAIAFCDRAIDYFRELARAEPTTYGHYLAEVELLRVALATGTSFSD